MTSHSYLSPIQTPLTMVIPLKEGKTVDDVQQFMIEILPENMDALQSVGTIHFLRLLPFDNGKKVIFCSDYDGSFEKYCIDFAVTLGSTFFEPLFKEFAPQSPPTPVAEHIPEFTQTIAYFDNQPLFYYSAYPETTVQDMWFEFGDLNQYDEPIDFFRAEIVKDPYSIYAQMRSESPVYHSDALGSWMIFKFKDVERVLEDKQIALYSVVPGQTAELPDNMTEMMVKIREFWKDWPTTQMPPKHTPIRQTQEAGFGEDLVKHFKPIVQAIADGYIDRLQGQTSADLLQSFTFLFPITVMSQALGVPQEDLPKMIQWSIAITEFLSLGVVQPSELRKVSNMSRTIDELYAYFGDKIKEYRANPTHNILSHIIQAADKNGTMKEKNIVEAIAVYIFGSHGTTMNFLTNGLLALLQHPDQLAKLKANPDLVDKASVELLRYAGPVQIGTRVADVDVELSGVTIPAGDAMVLFYASANRDSEHLAGGDTLDITRDPAKNFATGGGIHNCLGYPFITLMGEVAFNTLLRRLPGLQLASDTPHWRMNFGFRGLHELPVTFDTVLPKA